MSKKILKYENTYNSFKYVRFAKAGDKVPVNPLEFNVLKEKTKKLKVKIKFSLLIFHLVLSFTIIWAE
jgi:hypothetical protein